jgi:hypothetical protein
MTSFRQIAANRRNASKSTGPTTEEGKQRSRCNAVRDGLRAETVIGALEDAAITANYDAQSAVERELVLGSPASCGGCAAPTIETGLFEIQADHLAEVRKERLLAPDSPQLVYALLGQHSVQYRDEPLSVASGEAGAAHLRDTASELANRPPVELARCFLRLANLPNFALDRLSRYEASLWRQVVQTLFTLNVLDRHKPQERRLQIHSCRKFLTRAL